MKPTVADVVVDALWQAGVRRCYGIVGDTINHLTNSIRKSELRWIHVRHEEVGGFAAGSEAYMTGQLAACAGTCGPGSLHFVNGIFESHRNGSPVLLIASDIARSEVGLGFPQHVDQRKIYEQCSVFCEYISHPDQTRRIMVMAAQAALSKRGVAVVIVNGDMFAEKVNDDLQWSVHQPRFVLRPRDEELQDLAALINKSNKIALYAGIGARTAHDQVVALSKRVHAPVVHTSRAKEFIEPNNPNNVGMTGILGNRAGMESIQQADLLLCLGTNFAWTQFYPEKSHIVQIDHDPIHIGRRTPVHMGLLGDVGDTIDALLPMLDQKSDRGFLDETLKQYEKDLQAYDKAAQEPDPTLIHPQFLTYTLDRLAAEDAIFTADGGSPMAWIIRHITANGKRRVLTSLMHGTMANAYPQAIGIKAAYPDRQVIAMCGDGGMTMLMGDLLTLVQEKLPVKLLVFNNGSLGFVEMEQRVEGLLDAFTSLQNPNFAELARACGLNGYRVENANDLEGEMRRWLDDSGPCLLDVKVNRMELVMPPKIEAKMVASTALFGIKGVLDGRFQEVTSLLRDNFLR